MQNHLVGNIRFHGTVGNFPSSFLEREPIQPHWAFLANLKDADGVVYMGRDESQQLVHVTTQSQTRSASQSSSCSPFTPWPLTMFSLLV